MHLPDLLHRNARHLGDVEAVRDRARRRTYAELERRAAGLATGLARRGLAPGDRIALIASNRAEALELVFACGMLGCVLVPLDAGLDAEEIAQRVEDAEARAVVVEEASRTDGTGRPSIVLGPDYEALVSEPPLARRSPTPDAACVQLYEGAAGRPRGVLLTHRNLVATVFAWLYELELAQAPDRLLLADPPSRVQGLVHQAAAIAAGAGLTLAAELEPSRLLETLAAERATHVRLPAAVLQRVLARHAAGERRVGDLRRIAYDGGPLTPQDVERVRGLFGCELVRSYGCAETTGIATVLRPADHEAAAPERLASAGRAVLTAALSVVDDEGRELGPGEGGEVLVRGEQVAPGYWKRDDATRARFHEGWFRTGDRGTLDPDGYLTLVERHDERAAGHDLSSAGG